MEIKEQYENYLTTHFSTGHKIKFNKNEFEKYYRYFKKNYGKYLPGKKDSLILDLGCGTGHFLYYLKKQKYSNYIGVDFGKQAIEFCKKNNMAPQIINSDVSDFLKKNKQKFDAIVFNDIIEHIPKQELIPLLILMRTRLSKNGVLIIKTPNLSNPITAGSSRYIDFTHTLGFTEESLSQVLKLAEFKNILIKGQDIFVFNPIVNILGNLVHFILGIFFRIMFLIYGRKTAKIFSKDIIAIATN